MLAEFGHLVESFVVNEVLKQSSWLNRSLRLGHYRTSDGHEVDLVIENEDGELVAVEVKAGSTYRREDLRGLAHLRDRPVIASWAVSCCTPASEPRTSTTASTSRRSPACGKPEVTALTSSAVEDGG